MIGLSNLPELREGDNVGELVFAAAEDIGGLRDADIVVIAHKIVSKAEGATVRLSEIRASEQARRLAGAKDPRHVEAILRESRRLIRIRRGFLVTETRLGFVCSSSGVDRSNVSDEDQLLLHPLDPDASARGIRSVLEERSSRKVGVIISDSFGRPFRRGSIDVAIGIAGLPAILDHRGSLDGNGRPLKGSRVAVADELASAAELVMGKSRRIPVAIIRGLDLPGDGTGQETIIPADRDLFR